MVKVIYQQKTQALRACSINEKFITVQGVQPIQLEETEENNLALL